MVDKYVSVVIVNNWPPVVFLSIGHDDDFRPIINHTGIILERVFTGFPQYNNSQLFLTVMSEVTNAFKDHAVGGIVSQLALFVNRDVAAVLINFAKFF